MLASLGAISFGVPKFSTRNADGAMMYATSHRLVENFVDFNHFYSAQFPELKFWENKMADWVQPKNYSSEEIDRAGDILTNKDSSKQDKIKAFEILYNWRAIHSYPMHVSQKGADHHRSKTGGMLAPSGLGSAPLESQNFPPEMLMAR